MAGYYPDSLERRDPSLIARLLPAMERFNAVYFRVESEGAERLGRGRVLFVGNHNGGIAGPDLLCTLALLWRKLGPESPLFALAHDFAMRQLPPLGRTLQRLGAVSATRANARRILNCGGQVLVYPGGDLEAYRAFSRRKQIVILPRTGFVDIARETGASIVPIVAAGAHRSACIVAEGKRIAELLRMRRWARVQRFPIALALPYGIAPGPWLPYLPLPFQIRLRVLTPMRIESGERSWDAAARVQHAMQAALDELSG